MFLRWDKVFGIFMCLLLGDSKGGGLWEVFMELF